MLCPECNTENSDNAKFCKNCGASLSGNGISQGPMVSQGRASGNQSVVSDNRNMMIIVLAVVLCAVIIVGALVLMNNNNSADSETVVTDDAADSVDADEPEESSTTASAVNSWKIHSGSISTGSSLSNKTYCSVYVGTEHAGENCKISVLYSRDGSNLNQGNIVPKTVDSSGYVSVPSAYAFDYYPDTALVTIYDANGKELDHLTVNLAEQSGTQTF